VDTSAAFLYGHRYWSDVKREVLEYAAASAPGSLNLTDQIKDVAGRLATRLKTDPSLLIGIVGVGFMTLQQIGVELFSIPATAPRSQWNEKPDEIIRRRARNDGPGLFAFLDPSARRYTVTFREYQPDSTFRAVKGQDLTMAAAPTEETTAARIRGVSTGLFPLNAGQVRAAVAGWEFFRTRDVCLSLVSER
jgi:hypothetical protein